MKAYKKEVDRLVTLFRELRDEQKRATSDLKETTEKLEQLKEHRNKSIDRDERQQLTSDINELEEKQVQLNEILSKDIKDILVNEMDMNKLEELKNKARTDHQETVKEKRKAFDKVEQLYQAKRSELNQATDRSDFILATRNFDILKRSLKGM